MQVALTMASMAALIPAIVIGSYNRTIVDLNESEERYRNLTAAAFEGVFITEQGRILDVNDQGAAMFGRDRRDLVGRPVLDFVSPEDRDTVGDAIRTSSEVRYEHRLVRSDGSVFDAEAQAKMVRVGDRTLRMTALRDITERKQAAVRIQQLNRVYSVLSHINQAIVREKDPQAMLTEACRIAVDQGQFRMAWAGLLDASGQQLSLAADSGADENTQRLLRTLLSTARDEERCAITLHAVRSGQHGISNDIEQDPLMVPWHDAARARGYRAMTSLPLKSGDRVIGTFNLYAGEPGVFDAEEMRLLDELAADISFALEVYEREAQRRRAEEARKQDEAERLRLVHDLGERVKELTALHQATRLLQGERPIDGALLSMLAELLPPAWQYPGICAARVRYGDLEAATPGWRDTPWTQVEQFTSEGLAVSLEVAYLEDRPASAEGPFLLEERQLLRSIADLFGAHLEQKRAKAALRASEERFRSAMEHSPIGMGLVSPEGRWLEANPTLCATLGYSREELVGQDLERITHPDDLQDDRLALDQLLAGEIEQHQASRRYMHKDSHFVWVQLNLSLARDGHGRPAHFIFQIQDITGRRASEAALLALNARYARHEAALTTLTRSYVTLPDNLAAVLKEITEVMARTLEVERASIWRFDAGRTAITCTELYESTPGRHSAGSTLYASDYPAYFQALAESEIIAADDAWHDPRTAEFVAAWLRPHGITSMLDTPLRSRGVMVGIVCCEHVGPGRHWMPDEQTFAAAVANLVSGLLAQVERHQLEAQLRQAQKMEAIGQLAGGVAHDFNNVLAVIQMQADLLLGERDLPASVAESASEIEQATERAARLTRQLLLFSRREAPQPRDLDLNDVISQITRMIERILGEDIRLQLRQAPESLLIRADPGMVDQILMNLAVNSRDAMPRGGHLIIETCAVTRDVLPTSASPHARPGPYVCVSVIDSGCGIGPEALPRIFEPFFTTKDVGKGTGLGLATVFGIVEQHQGWIDVDSAPGRGTTFHVYLPRLLHSSNVLPALPPGSASPRGGTETILLVEDDAAVRAGVRQALARLGYRVLEAASGVQALEVWREHGAEIRVMLTDMVMPDGMNGRELAEILRLENPALTVIYSSGYSADIAGDALQLVDGINFLAKPFPVHKLARMIRDSIDCA